MKRLPDAVEWGLVMTKDQGKVTRTQLRRLIAEVYPGLEAYAVNYLFDAHYITWGEGEYWLTAKGEEYYDWFVQVTVAKLKEIGDKL